MREKLRHAQALLQSVVTSDWAGIEEHARQLHAATADPAWVVLQTPAYTRHTESFQRSTAELIEAAKAHDMESASLSYVSITLSCVQCHRQVARSRIAQKAPSAGALSSLTAR